MCLSPPIEKIDSSLNQLVNVRHLSLSTNCIVKMIAGLEEVGATLKELWISYNSISSLDGLGPCIKLHTLFISNNKIKDWSELAKLQSLPELKNILLLGNPIYMDENLTRKQARPRVLEQLPSIVSLDGEMLTGDDGPDEEEAEP